jgi:hypothetical protein
VIAHGLPGGTVQSEGEPLYVLIPWFPGLETLAEGETIRVRYRRFVMATVLRTRANGVPVEAVYRELSDSRSEAPS